MTERSIMKKICLLGDAAVGKTSLIRRFVYDVFDDKYITTFGAKVTTKRLTLEFSEDKVDLTLIIWDILGQRMHDKLHAGHYQGAKGALIVCDLTRGETVADVETWLQKIWETCDHIPAILLGNKCDLPHDDTEVMLKEIAVKYGLKYYITSAKKGMNVEDAFRTLSDIMING
jgi:small GTP-binding protein